METHTRLNNGPSSKLKLVKNHPRLYSRASMILSDCRRAQPCDSHYSFIYFQMSPFSI